MDGTKIVANGNAIKTNKEKMAKQLDELWQYAQAIAGEELKDTVPLTLRP